MMRLRGLVAIRSATGTADESTRYCQRHEQLGTPLPSCLDIVRHHVRRLSNARSIDHDAGDMDHRSISPRNAGLDRPRNVQVVGWTFLLSARLTERIKRAIPWLVALTIAAVIFVRFDVKAIAEHMRTGPWERVFPIACGLPFVYVFIHAIWDRAVFLRMLGGPRYVDILRGRVGTAVTMIIGFVVGHGAFGVWLARKTGQSAARVSGAIVFTLLSDLCAVGVVAATATWLGGADVPRAAKRAALLTATAPIVVGVVLPRVIRGNLIERLSFFDVWRKVPAFVGVLQILGRAADIAMVVAFTWQGTLAFGIEVPPLVFFTYMPVVLLVQSLPFNIAGIGAAQAAWLVFTPWAPAEKILAFQLLWQTFFALGLLVRGIPFVRSVSRDMRAGSTNANTKTQT